LINLLVFLVTSLLESKKTNSKNSSLPPSQDPYRKTDKNPSSEKKRGGQKGRKGVTLEPVKNPDEEIFLSLDKDFLPKGHQYTEGVSEKRQVFDIVIQRNIIEYSAQVWVDENGKKYTAEFPKEVKHSVQYGKNVKAHAVYLSQYQLIPTQRISEYFSDKLNLPISEGSICNWNTKASELLETLQFPELLHKKLQEGEFLHLDETGFKIGSKNNWLHVASNNNWTKLFCHEKRGKEAMDEMGILENYEGVMIHDHWKPYYKYDNKTHSLCNAHHLRELQGVIDKEEKHKWAEKMKKLLIETKISTEKNDGILSEEAQKKVQEEYREILQEAGKKEGECPPSEEKDRGVDKNGKKKRGRVKKTKPRNLLERLQNFEDDVLRFMTKKSVPFTNNQ
jgi:transposase